VHAGFIEALYAVPYRIRRLLAKARLLCGNFILIIDGRYRIEIRGYRYRAALSFDYRFADSAKH